MRTWNSAQWKCSEVWWDCCFSEKSSLPFVTTSILTLVPSDSVFYVLWVLVSERTPILDAHQWTNIPLVISRKMVWMSSWTETETPCSHLLRVHVGSRALALLRFEVLLPLMFVCLICLRCSCTFQPGCPGCTWIMDSDWSFITGASWWDFNRSWFFPHSLECQK